MNRNQIERWVRCAVCTVVAGCAAPSDRTSPDSVEAPAASGAAGSASDSATDSWCSAREVLERKCQRCHGSPAAHGAPFSLVGYEDTQTVNASGEPRYELIARVVASNFMPPAFIELDPEVEPLTEPERTALLAWCEAGAPAPATDESACDSR